MSAESVRSGFLSDGRFYSIEVAPHHLMWEARVVCVPGGESYRAKVVSEKQVLHRWAERLSVEDIEALLITGSQQA
jgi:hypothetical protein